MCDGCLHMTVLLPFGTPRTPKPGEACSICEASGAVTPWSGSAWLWLDDLLFVDATTGEPMEDADLRDWWWAFEVWAAAGGNPVTVDGSTVTFVPSSGLKKTVRASLHGARCLRLRRRRCSDPPRRRSSEPEFRTVAGRELTPEEWEAGRVVAHFTGGVLIPLDGAGAADATPDFEIASGGGRIALEVTSTADPEIVSLTHAAAGRTWPAPRLRSDWWVKLTFEPRSISKRAGRMIGHLAVLEERGIDRFDDLQPVGAKGSRERFAVEGLSNVGVTAARSLDGARGNEAQGQTAAGSVRAVLKRLPRSARVVGRGRVAAPHLHTSYTQNPEIQGHGWERLGTPRTPKRR